MHIRSLMLLPLVLVVLTAAPLTAQAGGEPLDWGGILPGDMLRVHIAREPDLSFEQTVPADGRVAFYRLGPMDVRGRDAEELRTYLLQEYSRYLVEPAVTVEVRRKVQILGAVQRPDIYTLHATMSISDAVAAAGGALPSGRTDRVELRRDGELVDVLLLSDRTPLADSPIRSGDQLFVPERSYIARNTGLVTTLASSLMALIFTLVVR